MNNPWFRMYAEFLTDAKVQMMSEAYQRRYIMLLCMSCLRYEDVTRNVTVTLQEEEIAFHLRISNEEWAETKAVFRAKNLIDEHNKPVAWEKRQYLKTPGAERVARHREKLKRYSNVTCNAPDTDTDTDTDKPSNLPSVGLKISSLRSEIVEKTGEPIFSPPDAPPENFFLQNENDENGNCPIQKIIEHYHSEMPDNPKVKKLTKARIAAIRNRWRESMRLEIIPFLNWRTKEGGLIECWRIFFAICNESDFLTGKNESTDGRPPFIADIDFLMRESSFAKILENKYHR